MEVIKKKRMHKDLEKRKLAKEIEKEQEREWEDNRDKRAKDWRSFQRNSKGGRKRTMKTKVRMEMRPKSAPKVEEGRPLGVQEGYKKEWR